MKKWPIFIFVLVILAFAVPKVAFAHRDGCHRWHSCPSDTGSYVCGDLGYDTYCPKAPAPTPTPMPVAPTATPLSAAPIPPTPMPTNSTTSITGSVNAASLNVRSGPSTSYQSVGSLSQGTQVAILEELNGWLRIELPNISPAWVSATYVTKTASASPAPSAAPAAPQSTGDAPILIAPVGGIAVNDPPIFTWSWAKPLGADEGFDVQVWKDGESPAGVAHPSFVVNNGNGTYTLSLPSLPNPKANDYLWRVRVINIKTGAEIAPSAQPANFRYE